MALRQVGSSLVAKASPGAAYRQSSEQRITKPAIPGKAEVGSVGRKFLEEPFNQAVPGGSEKVVRSGPGIESQPGLQTPSPTPQQQATLSGAIGMPSGASQLRSGANTQSLFQGGVSSPSAPAASAVTRGGKTASVSSSSGNLASAMKPMDIGLMSEGPSSSYQAPKTQDTVGSFYPGIGSLGNRASADEPGVSHEIPKNFGQAVIGTLGRVAQNIGTAFRAPEMNLGEKAQSIATNPSITQSGVGSISKPEASIKAIGNVLRSLVGSTPKTSPSMQASSSLRSQPVSPVNQLRSAASSVASNAKNAVSSLVSKISNLFKR